MELIIKEKLEPEFKAKWITALRSDLYEQGKNYLYDNNNDTYCCLGVAGAICNIPKIKLYKYFFNSSDNVPSLIMGSGVSNGIIGFLSTRNDGCYHTELNPSGEKLSFTEIADWIEINL